MTKTPRGRAPSAYVVLQHMGKNVTDILSVHRSREGAVAKIVLEINDSREDDDDREPETALTWEPEHTDDFGNTYSIEHTYLEP